MKQLLKSWLPIISGTKKFLAADLAFRLSRKINRRMYEVVFEGFIDPHNPESEQPDIVIYHKNESLRPVMIIEICDSENINASQRAIEMLSVIHCIDESFVYDLENDKWYLLKKGTGFFEESSFSELFDADLNRLLLHSGYQRLAVA
jgi:hypothetical protein